MSRRQRGSDVMSAGPSVPVRRSGGRTPSAGRRSPGRRSPARRSPGSQDDRDTLAEKLNEMSRRKQEAQKMLRAAEDELTLAKSRLQRAETEGRQKDKTIDELLNANAGGVTDSSSLRRTQQPAGRRRSRCDPRGVKLREHHHVVRVLTQLARRVI